MPTLNPKGVSTSAALAAQNPCPLGRSHLRSRDHLLQAPGPADERGLVRAQVPLKRREAEGMQSQRNIQDARCSTSTWRKSLGRPCIFVFLVVALLLTMMMLLLLCCCDMRRHDLRWHPHFFCSQAGACFPFCIVSAGLVLELG